MSRANIPIPSNFGKRITLTEQLDRLRQAPDTEQWEVLQKVAKESKEYRGFRHHAPGTQKRQDHHLAMYTDWKLFKARKQHDDFSAEELDNLLFPDDDHAAMLEEFRQFLLYVYSVTHPRSALTGQRITYRTLGHYRDSLIFWANRSFHLRKLSPPPDSMMYFQTTEAMRGVIKANPNTAFTAAPKAHLGLAELRELFDEEMLYNTSVEYAEQHWAAWCIARTTACRPGSICVGKYSTNPPLKWGDLDFQVGNEPGKFALVIRFNNIHIKRPADPEAQARRPQDDFLHVFLDSPEPRNLIFSPAHRLLVIAIRRGLLYGIDTVADLMQRKHQYIMVKPQFLNQPLFFSGMPKGEGIDFSRPLTASALADYLKTRAHRLGWNFTIMGMNALRRRSLTDLVTRVGLDSARRIAGHSPESTTLERYYLYISPMFDQTGALMDQSVGSGGFSDEHRKRWAPLVMGKIEDERVRKTRGAALRTMTDRLVLADRNPPEQATTLERKAYRKRLRRFAHQALLEHERAQSRLEMTQEEFRNREASLQASSFADTVLRKALDIQRSVGSGESDEAEFEEWDGFDDADEFDGDDEQVDDDLEVTAAERSSDLVTIPPEVEMDEAIAQDEVQDLSYEHMATAFMEMLLDNTLNVKTTWSEREKTCPLCQADETVSAERRAFEYQSKSHLDNHISGSFHTLQLKFDRSAESRKADHQNLRYTCPYCAEAAEDRATFFRGLGVDMPNNEYASRKLLAEHILESNEQTDGKKHDELKALGGWYDVDFHHTPSTETNIKSQQAGRKALKKIGIEVIQQRLVVGGVEPFEGFPGVVKGYHDGVPQRFTNVVKFGEPVLDNIPPKFAKSISRGTNQTSVIPEPFNGSVVAHGFPVLGHRTAKLPTVDRRSHAYSKTADADYGRGGSNKRKHSGEAEEDPLVISSGEEQSEDDDAE